MNDSPLVVGISGSLREQSTTYIALGHVLDAASDVGADVELVDLREWDLPLFDPDRRDRGDAAALRELVGKADAVILATPVYHGMISSALKNAFDYLGTDEFRDKVVGLMATAGGGSYAPTLAHLRTGVRTVHGWTLPHEVGIRRASEQFDAAGDFVDSDLEQRVRRLGRLAAEHAASGSLILDPP